MAEAETTPNPISRLPVDFLDCLDYHDAVDQLKLLNRGAGFVVTIDRTKADNNALRQIRKVFLRCWKSRVYKSSSTGRRRPHTRSTECPWRATLTRQDGGWRVEVKHLEHNHELDEGSPPRPAVLRRQVPKAPLRALAALTPYQAQGEVLQSAPAVPPSNAPQPFPPIGNAVGDGSLYAPQAFSGYSQYPSVPTNHPPSMPFPPSAHAGTPSQNQQGQGPSTGGYTWLTPLGPQSAARTIPPRPFPPSSTGPPPSSGPPPPSAGPPPSTGKRVRRGGYAVMSEIPRYKVPLEQRTVATPRNQIRPEPPAFLVYHEDFNSILGENPDLKIAYEDKFPFAHGAAIYSPQRDVVFVTSRPLIPSGKLEKAVKINKLTREAAGTWRRDEVLTLAILVSGGTNFGDHLLFCSQGDYRDLGGLVHIEADYPHRSSIMLNNYLGRRFNSPNDVAVHSDGSLWFTDPIYGFEQGLRRKPELPNQVYQFDPQSGEVRVAADGLGRPKGICFSPREKILYISDNDAFHGDGSVDQTRAANIYAYDILEKRRAKWLINRRVFAMPDTGVPDGIKCDAAGNVYAGCGDGLNVWNSSGSLLGKVLIPGGITNFCFGKPGELFLLNDTRFWQVKVDESVKGIPARPTGSASDQERESSVDSMESLFGADNGVENDR